MSRFSVDLGESLQIALRALRANKARGVLTTLGIVIGIVAVVVTMTAANGLTDSMLAEVPPNDGHRENLLNTGFTRIGLSIVRDAKGITWMTQDFVA